MPSSLKEKSASSSALDAEVPGPWEGVSDEAFSPSGGIVPEFSVV